MQRREDSEEAVILYGIPPQDYPYLPAIHTPPHTLPGFVISNPGEYSCEQDPCHSDCPPPSSPQKAYRGLYVGSAPSLNPPNRLKQDTSSKFPSHLVTEDSRSSRSIAQGWNTSTSIPPMSTPLTPSSSQSSVCLMPDREHNGTMGAKVKPTKRPQSSPSKRPTPEEFRSLVLFPREHEALLREYVGTDSKYTLAKNHAGMMIRAVIKSHDLASKMREVAEALDAIDLFLAFLLESQGLKQEQKGCVSLRICFGALTALLGDFSQGGSVENFVSDPHAAVIPREQLGQFRSFNPILREILCRLAAKLEKSMNLYRHRRSPSGSLVAKFQEMSDTLEIWNRHLMDDTFASPSRIASDWLKNHPNQVDSRRRNQAYSEQPSPNPSDGLPSSSPSQSDSNYLSPLSAYGEPSRPSNRGNIRSTGMDQHESLFKGPTGVGGTVSYFSSTSMTPTSVPYNPNNLYRTGGFELPPLPDDLGMFAPQNHSNSQYHATGSNYPAY